MEERKNTSKINISKPALKISAQKFIAGTKTDQRDPDEFQLSSSVWLPRKRRKTKEKQNSESSTAFKFCLTNKKQKQKRNANNRTQRQQVPLS